MQWHNRWGRRHECPPDAFHWEIFADLPGKEREEKRENGEEKKENCQREGGNFSNGNLYKMKQRTLFFFFVCFHFLKQLKFVLGLPKSTFLPGKACHARKKLGKVILPLLNLIFLLCHWLVVS